MDKRLLAIIIFVLGISQLRAQEIKPRGEFLSDSIKIGQEIGYALTVKYPKRLQIIYPDSTYSFGSFEFYSKKYFETTVDSTMATDSVVYGISTFEIDPIQSLQLPIYILNGADSVEIMSNLDSVILVQYVAQVPDSLSLIKNVDYFDVDYDFNYPYLMIGLGIFAVLIIGAAILFGKKIKMRIKLYRMKKDFERFSINLEIGISNIRKNQSDKTLIEEVLIVWKTYMEKLEDKPFTKYTSKEIERVGYESLLIDTLKNIDRAIYSNVTLEEIHKNFESLEDFTANKYQEKVNELKSV
ncbi:hypothetical protein [Reichenbachiella versicolor]|uniref:hypothetical protein n=1 Tax=Reichenbachiella versicolor TaxID=1821036 RepID=UPI000D6E3377|nr:hypothetical protein [Reichenbachiella versicolor]